jgi:nitrogen-specific signal transduction histidine kinase/CheY-like chemotaxis protein
MAESLRHGITEVMVRGLRRLADLHDRLRQSQKMEAVGQLTGGIAHDFNNLLAGILGSLEMLQTRMTQGRFNEVDRYIGVAVTSANRAASLTHRLLAFSRRQMLDSKTVDVNRLTASMEDLIRRTVGPAIQVETVISGNLWKTLCDANQLESALLNLAINARDAMPDGGRLTIETANVRLDEAYAGRHPEVAAGQYVAVSVTDTGTGMAPDVIARVFEPFFTTKPLGQGTGLGLSMVYGFAQQSNGCTRVYSEPGRGTTVRLYLPRSPETGETEASEPEASPDTVARAGETVLVVDDEPAVRMLIGDSLRDFGYDVIEAADGAEGLRVLQTRQRVDLLVSDVGLPGGMNGRQLADAARVQRPRLKVLFITGYAENAVFGKGGPEPDMQVITKPFALDVLAARIREML